MMYYIYLVVRDGMNTDLFIFSFGVCLNRFTSSSSSGSSSKA